jgi:hypothetical protein
MLNSRNTIEGEARAMKNLYSTSITSVYMAHNLEIIESEFKSMRVVEERAHTWVPSFQLRPIQVF